MESAPTILRRYGYEKEILNGVPIPYDRSVEALRRQKFVLDRMVGIW